MLNTNRIPISALGQLFDGPHATPTRRTDGPYFLNISSLKDGRLDLSESDHVSQADFVKWTRRVTPQPGDLLFSYETRLGEAALMPEGVEACLGRRMALLRPDPSVVDPRFLLYFYLSPYFQELIARNTIHGATVPRIGLASMPRWEVEIPSDLGEQKAVAEVLGALDDKIAANGCASSTARHLSNAHLRQTLSVHPGKLVTLSHLTDSKAIEFSDGYRTKRSEHGTPGIRILRAGDVRDFRIIPDGPDCISAEYRERIGAKASKAGDIVLTTKGTVGRVAIVPSHMEEIVYSPQMCYFRVQDERVVDFGFLAAWFSSRDLADQLSIYMHKSDMAPYVNLQDIRSLRISLPDITVQRTEGLFQRSMFGIMHSLSRENDILMETRDELLSLLMSGRIRVRDAEKVVGEVV